MRNLKANILESQAISSTNTVTSSAVDIRSAGGYSVVLTVTGTATGTAKLQASNDNSVWVDLPNSGATATIAVSGANNHLWNVAGAMYAYVRVSYTNATNSGTLSAVAVAKSGAQ